MHTILGRSVRTRFVRTKSFSSYMQPRSSWTRALALASVPVLAWLFKTTEEENVASMLAPTLVTADEQTLQKGSDPLTPATRTVDGEEYEHFPYVIVGGGTAAFAAVKTLKEGGVTDEILVLTSESVGPYLRPPLSKELWFSDSEKEEDGTKRKLVYSGHRGEKTGIDLELPDGLAENVVLVRNTTVTDISPDQKLIRVAGNIVISYGKCLLATGSSPKKLDVPHPQTASITTFRTQEDFRNLEAVVESPNNTHITVVGGGLLGTELAYGLATKGKKTNTRVSLVVKDSAVLLKYLPDYLGEHVTAKLKEAGVDVITEGSVKEITEGDSLKVVLNDGRELTTNHVVVAIGSQPNNEIAKTARLEIDPNNHGIVTNAQWMVSQDLYAAGEVASHWDTLLGRKRVEHHLYAYDSGKGAAKSMLGSMEYFFEWPIFWGTAAGTPYTAIGIIDPSLETVGAWLKAPVNIPTLIADPDAAELASATAPSAMVPIDREGQDNVYEKEGKFENGVVYYTKNKKVVGVLLWNVYDKIPQARRALQLRDREYAELSDIIRAIPWELDPKSEVPPTEASA